MEVIDNHDIIEQVRNRLPNAMAYRGEAAVMDPFTKDFSLRFCWSSNAIEGNTLSLDETISVIEYDEVRGGHTYSEYRDAKNLCRSVTEMMIPFRERELSGAWLQKANALSASVKGEILLQSVSKQSIID